MVFVPVKEEFAENTNKRYHVCTNKHGDSKSDVLLCFDTKFKS